MRSLKTDVTTSQDLTAGDLDYTTSFGRRFKLEKIIFHASGNITETITISLDSKHGSDYDAVIRKKSLSSEQDYVWVPEGENNYQAGDEIRVQCTNANLSETIYVTLKTREVLI